jgi:hypothetical protein
MHISLGLLGDIPKKQVRNGGELDEAGEGRRDSIGRGISIALAGTLWQFVRRASQRAWGHPVCRQS